LLREYKKNISHLFKIFNILSTVTLPCFSSQIRGEKRIVLSKNENPTQKALKIFKHD